MRTASLVLSGVLTIACTPGRSRDPEDARDAVERVSLQAADGHQIGIIASAAACGNDVYLGDASGLVWHLDVRRHAGPRTPMTLDAQHAPRSVGGVGVDCERHALYVLDSMTRTLVEFDSRSGVARTTWPIGVNPLAFTAPPAGPLAVVPGVAIVLHGVATAGSDPDRAPSTDQHYAGRHVGLMLSPATGEWTTAFTPFDNTCRGRCAQTSINTTGHATDTEFTVTLPTTPTVGFYDDHYSLVRVVDVASPGFLRSAHEPVAPSDTSGSILWARTNSMMRTAAVCGGYLASIHETTDVPDDWQPGTTLVQWRQKLNVHDLDGSSHVLDHVLPGYYVGHDDERVISVDYGPDGRQRSAERVDIVLTRPRQLVQSLAP
ncbi:MAG: hypothetical protein IT182_12955 [Acidobacteria bacterium]|nr:hypothetical protein [Acidobacteriota bacterium]